VTKLAIIDDERIDVVTVEHGPGSRGWWNVTCYMSGHKVADHDWRCEEYDAISSTLLLGVAILVDGGLTVAADDLSYRVKFHVQNFRSICMTVTRYDGDRVEQCYGASAESLFPLAIKKILEIHNG
jgi:hypothetical protein